MKTPSQLIRPLIALAALAAVAVTASGCGTTTADVERGRVLFVEKHAVHRFHSIEEDLSIVVAFSPPRNR